jgi:sigma54-dependent transcription regulator
MPRECDHAFMSSPKAPTKDRNDERGAFTGARSRHIGCLEEANGSTLFVDAEGNLTWRNKSDEVGDADDDNSQVSVGFRHRFASSDAVAPSANPG